MNWQAFGAFGVACTAAGYLLGILVMAIRQDHRDKREFDAEINGQLEQLAANRAQRHAKSQPRAGERAPSPGAVPQIPRPQPTYRRGGNGQWFRDVPARPAQRLVTTATDLAPVFYPQPGVSVPVRPQRAPDKRGADDTGRMPRVRLLDTSTGGMTAITDAWIAEHCPEATV